jgi:hypothetical protein
MYTMATTNVIKITLMRIGRCLGLAGLLAGAVLAQSAVGSPAPRALEVASVRKHVPTGADEAAGVTVFRDYSPGPVPAGSVVRIQVEKEARMVDTVVEALILDFLDWVKARDRSYEEALDAWRTSCPRLPVWEEANDRGLIVREEVNGTSIVRVTPAGLALLASSRRCSQAPR